ncbi:hypothetical protein [Arenimonas sp. MALMAid1274]|uniref:hypothetical protein n=1 Tax=Arenimonas sp. MALMAid1274 TaxID=3411630 RepID=UPI003B9E570A
MKFLWRQRRGRIALLGVAVAAAVIAVLGGFGRADVARATLAVSGANQAIASDAFSITPTCAWTSEVRPGQAASGPQRYLILRATVVNKASDWLAMQAYLDRDVIWLPTGSGEPVNSERTQRADDATVRLTLGPGLPVRVDFIWELPAGMVPPTQATWGLFARRHVARSYASGEEMWVQDGPGGKFVLPVGTACDGALP